MVWFAVEPSRDYLPTEADIVARWSLIPVFRDESGSIYESRPDAPVLAGTRRD